MQSNKPFPIYGATSIALALLATVPIAILTVLAFLTKLYALTAVDDFMNNPKNEILFELIVAGMFVVLATGIAFGLVEVLRKKGNKIYAVFGISLNVLILLGITAMIIIGSYAEV